MKLGEALSERAECAKKIANLRQRINSNISSNEGEDVAEDPEALLAQVDAAIERLAALVLAINTVNTNTLVTFQGQQITITHALAIRDGLSAKIATYEAAAQTASNAVGRGAFRMRGTELKTVLHVNVAHLRELIDGVTTQRRALDAVLQTASWNTEVGV